MAQHLVRVNDPGDYVTQRMVLVDDTNPNIQYSGPWFAVQNTQAHLGNLGPPFQNTLHGVSVNSNLSFSFSGSSVTVLGTSITNNNASGSQDPTWECFVDNNSIGWSTVLQIAENNWPFCQSGQLKDGPHVLTVKANVANQHTFWFDQIQYLPSSNASLDQSILRIDSSDSAMQYSSGWQPSGGLVNFTQTAGSTLTYRFSGISVSWVGFIPSHSPLNSSSATYSVDGQIPINFLVPALSSSTTSELFNQVLFTTEQLSAGQHQLVVTHQGNSSTAPLVLDYFVLQNGPNPSGSSSTLNQGSSSSSTTTKAIIGGVVGGIILLLLLLILFLFNRRRKNRGKPDASHETVDPLTAPTVALVPQLIANKFGRGNQPTARPTTSSDLIPRLPPTDTGPSMPALPALRNPNSSLPAIIPPSSQPLVGTQTNFIDDTMTRDPEAETVPLTRRLASPRRGDGRLLRHEDSGIRMPPADNDLVELPPFYTPG